MNEGRPSFAKFGKYDGGKIGFVCNRTGQSAKNTRTDRVERDCAEQNAGPSQITPANVSAEASTQTLGLGGTVASAGEFPWSGSLSDATSVRPALSQFDFE